jgi:hypothetical protein
MYTEQPIPGPLGLGDLLDRAFRLYRARFWTLVAIGAVFLIPYAIISGALSGQINPGTFDFLRALLSGSPEVLENLPATPTDPSTVLGLSCLSYLVSLLGLVLSGWVALSLTHQNIATLHNKAPSLGESIRAGLDRLLAWVGMSFAQWVVIVALFFVAFVPFFCGLVSTAAGTTRDGPNDTGLLALGGSLLTCGILLVAAGVTVYLLTRWIVAVPGMVAERWGPLQALRNSWALTKDYFWRSLVFAVLLIILGWVITSVPSFVLGLGIAVLPFPGQVTAIILNIASTAITLLWQPIQVAAIVLLYYDLRVRKEGYDLALRVERLESEIDRPDTPGLEPGAGAA